MNKSSYDYRFLITLIFLMIVGGYWIVNEFRREGLNRYLDLLGEKLVSLVPDTKKKQDLAVVYDDFKKQVEEKKVKPEQVEEVAASILNLTNSNDTLGLKHTQALIEIAMVDLGDSLLNLTVLPENPDADSPEMMGETEKWKKLEKRLKDVYEFDIKFNERKKEHLEKSIQYIYDNKLQIIVDSKMRQNLILEEKENLIKELNDLEKDNLLIWDEIKDKDILEKIRVIEEQIKSIPDKKSIEEAINKSKSTIEALSDSLPK